MVKSYNWYEEKLKKDMALMISSYLNNPDKIWDDSKGYGYIDIGSKFDLCKLLIMVNRGLIMDGVYSTSFKINTKRLRIIDRVWEWNVEEEISLAQIVGYIQSTWYEIEKFITFLDRSDISQFIQEKGNYLYFDTNRHYLPLVDKPESMVRCLGVPIEVKWDCIDNRDMPTGKLISRLNNIDQEMWNFGKAFYEYLVSYTSQVFLISDDPNFFKHHISIYRNKDNKIVAKCDEIMLLPPDRLLSFLVNKGLNINGMVIDNPETFMMTLDIIK